MRVNLSNPHSQTMVIFNHDIRVALKACARRSDTVSSGDAHILGDLGCAHLRDPHPGDSAIVPMGSPHIDHPVVGSGHLGQGGGDFGLSARCGCRLALEAFLVVNDSKGDSRFLLPWVAQRAVRG